MIKIFSKKEIMYDSFQQLLNMDKSFKEICCIYSF